MNVSLVNFKWQLVHNSAKTTFTFPRCRLFKVNGRPIFIRGGNWILSDGLLRLSRKRYKADIKFHADMNFNMMRCWGGGLAERPEFYHFCDIYGLLVSALSLSHTHTRARVIASTHCVWLHAHMCLHVCAYMGFEAKHVNLAN